MLDNNSCPTIDNTFSEMEKIYKILVVDDEKSIRFTTKAILSKEGYDVSTANGYCEALDIMAKRDFDLVFTDVELGDNRTGVDILKVVKESNPNCPVILSTGNIDYMAASEAKLMGAYDYMIKPVNFESLLNTVSMALRYKTVPEGNTHAGANRRRKKNAGLLD